MSEKLFDIWEFIVNLSEPLLLYVILRTKLKCTPTKNIIALVGIVVLAVNTTIMNNIELSYVYTLLIMLVTYILYSLLLFEGKIVQRVLWAVSAIFIILVSNTILVNATVLLPNTSAVEMSMPTLTRFVVHILYFIINALLAFMLIKFTKRDESVPSYILAGIVCLCVLSIAALYLMADIATEIEIANLNSNLCVIISLILLTLTISIVILFTWLTKTIQRYANAQNEAKALQREIAYNKELTNVYNNIRQLRHDYTSHMNVILSLLSNDKIDELKEYMADYHAEYGPADYYALTGNTELDALLASKLMLCDSRNIKTKVAVRYWDNMGLTSVELISLFGNLLDNAMNACDEITEGDKFIRLTTQKIKGMLSINISNTYNSSAYSPDKPSKNGHGLGLPRIRSIVEKYNGVCDIFPGKDNFEVKIMIHLQNTQ